VFGFGDSGEDCLAFLQSFFGVFEKELAGDGEGDAASGAVEETGADFFLEGPNLGRDRGLGAKALFGSPREAGEARDFQKDFELIEVHARD
jgi:hypothetical protein